jgi:hypothetical protein
MKPSIQRRLESLCERYDEIATDHQIWYMKQLLEGMTGQGSAK